MKKIVVMIFSLTVLFVFASTSLPCYAGKKDSNRVQQPAGDDNVIYSCYKKVNGQTRIVSSPDDCRPSEESISWNTTGIDLSKTYAISCPSPNTGSCSCGSDGWVLQGYAECPSGAVLIRAGSPADMADIFQALCTQLDGTGTVDPASISIRCVGTPPPVTTEICNDGIDNDGNNLIDCADPACTSDPACTPPPVTTEICNDGIDNDGNNLIDCADPACTSDPACQTTAKKPTLGEDCSDCKGKNCKNDPTCTKQNGRNKQISADHQEKAEPAMALPFLFPSFNAAADNRQS